MTERIIQHNWTKFLQISVGKAVGCDMIGSPISSVQTTAQKTQIGRRDGIWYAMPLHKQNTKQLLKWKESVYIFKKKLQSALLYGSKTATKLANNFHSS